MFKDLLNETKKVNEKGRASDSMDEALDNVIHFIKSVAGPNFDNDEDIEAVVLQFISNAIQGASARQEAQIAIDDFLEEEGGGEVDSEEWKAIGGDPSALDTANRRSSKRRPRPQGKSYRGR